GNKHIDNVNIYHQPDRFEVRQLVDHMFRIIFPGYYRDRNVKIYNPDNSIAVNIEDTFYHLHKLVTLALHFRADADTKTEAENKKESYRICKSFFSSIPCIRDYVETDLLAVFHGDPAAESLAEVILAYPSIIAITTYRLAHELYQLNVPIIPRLMTEYAHEQTGIDIHPGATIGKHFFIDHGTGVVIGETSLIGDYVKIYQGVTIGALSTSGGQKLSGVKRHPTIGNHVTIYAGASILGGNTVIGDLSIIGSNTFITSSVPAGSRVIIKNLVMECKKNTRGS
ncbi:MAG: serine acetyltransferase, partial [Lachnospiraceae bacterium]|nr:serine acetyltransferase [Lachnospiraceae bacterium]